MKIEHKPDGHHYKNDDGTTIMRINDKGLHFNTPAEGPSMYSSKGSERVVIPAGIRVNGKIVPREIIMECFDAAGNFTLNAEDVARKVEQMENTPEIGWDPSNA